MANKVVLTVPYFQFYSNYFDEPDNMTFIHEQGMDGFGVLMFTIAESLKHGFAVPYNNNFIIAASVKTGVEKQKVSEIIEHLINANLLYKLQSNGYDFLTSDDLQENFQSSKKTNNDRRKTEYCVNEDLWILSDESTMSFIHKTGMQEDNRPNVLGRSNNRPKIVRAKEKKEKEKKEGGNNENETIGTKVPQFS